MSYKQSHLAWSSSTQPAHIRLPIRRAWGAAPSNALDTKFLRSWLVYDSSLEAGDTGGSASWNTILQKGHHIVPFQLVSALQEVEFDHKAQAGNLRPE